MHNLLKFTPMDITNILEPLNESQREAVAAPTGSTLVLAGADRLDGHELIMQA